jgi:NAD(P)-dependent dehydrogenase (short-subunit alcohol dehydrogenase family)
MKLKEKVAIVTGSGRGIGKAIASLFAKEGAHVIINDLDNNNCIEVLEEIKKYSPNSTAQQGDVSVGKDVEQIVNLAVKIYGKIDILVNNAGTGSICNLEDTTEEIWNRIIGVDLKGVFLCSSIAGKVMIEKKGGTIINIASNAAQAPIALGNAYSVAKAGVRMLTRLTALEWGKHNIRANSISPGFIRTPLTESAYADPEHARKRAELVPLKRIGTPEDVANLALFLASEESSYINGEDIVIDGGFLHTTYEQAPNKPKIS